MTHKVLKSTIEAIKFTPEENKRGIVNFSSAVSAYAIELEHWKDREAKIRAQEPLPPQPQWGSFKDSDNPSKDYTVALRAWEHQKLSHITPVPPPAAHPDIVAAVDINGNPNFEIVDDGPTDDEILRQKKDRLLTTVAHLEFAAVNLVQLPIGKRRLANLMETDILEKDNRIAAKAIDDAASRGIVLSEAEINNIIKSSRSHDHDQHIASQIHRRDKIKEIHRKVAYIMSDIEDLTVDTIDTFTIPDLN